MNPSTVSQRSPVTLQINLAPSDYRHAELILPHQLAVWRNQVDEILLVVDVRRGKGRFAAGWEQGKDRLTRLLAAQSGTRLVEVDYSEAGRKRVADTFFGGRRVPEKDFRGGPYYAYFYALTEAGHDRVLHTDSDLFFGGGSQSWIAEAGALFSSRPDVVFASPLPGPPAADGKLHSQHSEPEPGWENAFRFSGMSTRIFYYWRSRFQERIGALHPHRPRVLREQIHALMDGHPCAELPERLITAEMERRHLLRIDFLGSGPGMWTLHPPYRGKDFYDRLPELIRQVENNDVPEAQRGCHDVNDSMVDWSEGRDALRSNRWWRRLARRAGRG